ncbi:hypothetical protein [Bdellovibrio reynosensis]|uniref:Zinc-regulated TonB-dependent outer membrane receptor n=1 Tax=Bdellovibrio reynosensis TaxID=2835041 RepID=A0ABY4C7I6_9BACT|nr:hypothetical protein [Bdellovibrio reynosensis]UOF00890.1 hypothetical protein MNR06_14405 [Bdellovibrio reynosensis]
MKLLVVLSWLVLSLNAFAQEEDHEHFETRGALDLRLPFDFENSSGNTLNVQAAELVIQGPINHHFSGLINLTAHGHEDDFKPELHEAYVVSKNLIPSSKFKIGKFLLDVGGLNNTHPHDWFFTSAPKVHNDFFSEEGLNDTGFEYSFLHPAGKNRFTFTIGVSNGYHFGHTHEESGEEEADERPHVPTHYLHPSQLFATENGFIKFGATYVGRTDAQGIQTQIYGFDFTKVNGEVEKPQSLIKSELLYRNLSAPGASATEELGTYVYAEQSLNEKWSAGFRVDLFTELSRTEADLSKKENLNYALTPSMIYRTGHSSVVRFNYSYEVQTNQGENDQLNQKLELQLVAYLGDHYHED